jgi:hypothetical protein
MAQAPSLVDLRNFMLAPADHVFDNATRITAGGCKA